MMVEIFGSGRHGWTFLLSVIGSRGSRLQVNSPRPWDEVGFLVSLPSVKQFGQDRKGAGGLMCLCTWSYGARNHRNLWTKYDAH